MEIIDLLSPKPLDPYTRETYETKMFYNVSDALHRVGIHGDDNTIETCRVLGIKDCCDKTQQFKKKGIINMSDVMAVVSLEDTVTGMTNSDYKERFRAEYAQTKIRYEKLKAFCNRIEVAEMMGTEPPKHDCPLELLREQQKHMGMYLSVLEKRAIIENVIL